MPAVSNARRLLTLDGLINAVLGVVLLLSPLGTLELLGLPLNGSFFWVSLLGAVLLGIGAALLIEVHDDANRLRGLGLAGAIAINVCGASVLVLWLLVGDLDLPSRGRIVLWTVALVVLGLALVEAIGARTRQL